MKIRADARLGAYDSVYFSPHLDDVALSCPLTVLRDVEVGRRVLVVTLFSHAVAGADEANRQLYATRREEDDEAMAALGVDHLHAGLPDAPFRSPTYDDFQGIVFRRDPEDDATLIAAREVVSRILERAHASRVIGPLGVGAHIDHRLTHELAPPDSLFYEDRPYAFVEHAVALRLSVLGAGEAVGPDAVDREFLPSLFASPMGGALCATREQRESACREFHRLAALAPPHRRTADSQTQRFGIDELRRAQDIVERYRSQLTAVLGGAGRYAAMAASYAAELGETEHAVERFWSLTT